AEEESERHHTEVTRLRALVEKLDLRIKGMDSSLEEANKKVEDANKKAKEAAEENSDYWLDGFDACRQLVGTLDPSFDLSRLVPESVDPMTGEEDAGPSDFRD
ncbi:Unknown protein, partial [Striga hermonthica]